MRIATFNLENLALGRGFEQRIALMRPQMLRLRADILCLQEISGEGEPRGLPALDKLLEGTPYADYARIHTLTEAGQPLQERNLVILSRYPILERKQHDQEASDAPHYRCVTAIPPEETPSRVTWDRPILYAKIELPGPRPLHLLNLHLKSKLPSDVFGQKQSRYKWKSASGWAEGFFLSSIKRVGQALQARRLIDALFDQDERAWIIACGDYNADTDEVTVEAIRGDVENTGNARLAGRVMIPCEGSIPEPARYTLIHHGKGRMIDHLLASRTLLAHYLGSEIHNELIHDESVKFMSEQEFPESDHAPLVAEFAL